MKVGDLVTTPRGGGEIVGEWCRDGRRIGWRVKDRWSEDGGWIEDNLALLYPEDDPYRNTDGSLKPKPPKRKGADYSASFTLSAEDLKPGELVAHGVIEAGTPVTSRMLCGVDWDFTPVSMVIGHCISDPSADGIRRPDYAAAESVHDKYAVKYTVGRPIVAEPETLLGDPPTHLEWCPRCNTEYVGKRCPSCWYPDLRPMVDEAKDEGPWPRELTRRQMAHVAATSCLGDAVADVHSAMNALAPETSTLVDHPPRIKAEMRAIFDPVTDALSAAILALRKRGEL